MADPSTVVMGEVKLVSFTPAPNSRTISITSAADATTTVVPNSCSSVPLQPVQVTPPSVGLSIASSTAAVWTKSSDDLIAFTPAPGTHHRPGRNTTDVTISITEPTPMKRKTISPLPASPSEPADACPPTLSQNAPDIDPLTNSNDMEVDQSNVIFDDSVDNTTISTHADIELDSKTLETLTTDEVHTSHLCSLSDDSPAMDEINSAPTVPELPSSIDTAAVHSESTVEAKNGDDSSKETNQRPTRTLRTRAAVAEKSHSTTAISSTTEVKSNKKTSTASTATTSKADARDVDNEDVNQPSKRRTTSRTTAKVISEPLQNGVTSTKKWTSTRATTTDSAVSENISKRTLRKKSEDSKDNDTADEKHQPTTTTTATTTSTTTTPTTSTTTTPTTTTSTTTTKSHLRGRGKAAATEGSKGTIHHSSRLRMAYVTEEKEEVIGKEDKSDRPKIR